MPKRRKKTGAKNSKALKRNNLSRDSTKILTSPNASLEQSISSGHDVIWNDQSPVTGHQHRIIGRSLMMTLRGKEGLVQKKEGHQLLELFKCNMKSIQHHHSNDTCDQPVKRSKRQELEEISKAQNELKQLAKRLQYYDDDVMEGKEDGTMKLELRHQSNTDHSRISCDVPVTSSPTIAPVMTTVTTHSHSNTSSTNITTTNANSNITTVAGKGQCSDSGVVESDTDTMSCCDDDSSPDQYQPIGSHHCRGVADNAVSQCRASPQDGGVANTRTCQSVNSDANNFPDTGITSDDDAELDRIFASVEMTSNSYNDTIDDEQFWSTAAIELSHQEVGLVHSTPCRPPAPPTVTSSNDSNGADFIDMLLTYNNDIDLILNQS